MATEQTSVRPVTKAVVPVAGLGTRFLPATKATPKEMLPVVDKPAIQYVVEEAVAAGLTDILMITGRNKNSLENHFDRNWELESALEAKGDVDRLARVQDAGVLARLPLHPPGRPARPRPRRPLRRPARRPGTVRGAARRRPDRRARPAAHDDARRPRRATAAAWSRCCGCRATRSTSTAAPPSRASPTTWGP